MIDESLAAGTTVLHRWHAAAKIPAATILLVVVAIAEGFAAPLAGLAAALALTVYARVGLRGLLARLAAANGFVCFLWLTLPFTYPGEPLFSVGRFDASGEGVRLAALLSLKTNCAVLLLIALLATSTVAALGHGLQRLGLPARLVFLLLFSYRYLFVIADEYQRLLRAAELRCFSPATTLHTYRTYAHLFAMTLVKSFNRAQRVQQAMLLRGFDGRLIPLRQRQHTTSDYLLLAFSTLYALFLAFVDKL